jgi:hypothetical protein
MIDITTCPECGEPAEVQWRDALESTDGPVEHAKIMCVRRHWFLLPVSTLDTHRGDLPATTTSTSTSTSIESTPARRPRHTPA